MITDYVVTIEVRVHDREALYQAAVLRAEEGGLLADSVNLKPGGEIDVEACLVMLFDPGVSPDGCQIENSSVEGTYASTPRSATPPICSRATDGR